MTTEDVVLECLNSGDENDPCRGEVQYHSFGRGKAFPRCDHHWRKRMKLEEQIIERYNPDGCSPPEGFDPMDAGERWDDDY